MVYEYQQELWSKKCDPKIMGCLLVLKIIVVVEDIQLCIEM